MTERNIDIKTDYEPINEREWKKAYLVARGIWKERELLPVTHESNNGETLGVSPLVIPLVGDSHIELGRFNIGQYGEETVYVEVSTISKNGEISTFGTNLTSMLPSRFGENDDFGFWIFFDNPRDTSQIKIVKYLAGFNPVRKIDWDHIKPKTSEMEVALSISQMVFEAQNKF